MGYGGEQRALYCGAGSGMEGETRMATLAVEEIMEISRPGVNMLEMGVGQDPRFRYRFRRDNDGTIVCLDDKMTWCEHLELLLKSGYDSKILFAEEAHWHGSKVMVPMIPKEDLWIELRAGKVTDHGAVAFDLVDPNRPLVNGLLDLQFLGFINPDEGEGRAVLREMVYDWFRANVTPRDLKCAVSAHSFREEMIVQKNLQSPGMAFPESFSLWATKNCLQCRKNIASIFDDMVPDK
jgi:hypothetical protein